MSEHQPVVLDGNRVQSLALHQPASAAASYPLGVTAVITALLRGLLQSSSKSKLSRKNSKSN